MDAGMYNQILLRYLCPFGSYKYVKYVLHQDNDPKHTSKLCKEFISDNNINWKKYFNEIICIYCKKYLNIKNILKDQSTSTVT